MLKSEKNLTPCPIMAGFYKVPNQPYSVSRDGIVFSYKSLKIVERSLPEKRAVTKTYVWVDKTHAHVLVAETFLEKPKLFNDRLVVNHRNGRVWDNQVDNLEWTTFQGNSVHAYITGLRGDNIVLLCKNIKTDEVKEFYSYNDCARNFGINQGRVHNYLHRKRKEVFFMENYLLIRKGEEWPEPEEYSTWISFTVGNDIAIIDGKSNKVILFSSFLDASSYIGISAAFLSKILKKARETDNVMITYKNWKILPAAYVSDYFKNEVVDRRKSKEEKLKNITPPNRKPIPIKVTNLQTMEERKFNSVEEFADLIGESKNTVQSHILRNDGVWRKQFRIDYLK